MVLRRRRQEKAEYLKRKHTEDAVAKKEKLNESLRTNKVIPHKLRGDAQELLDSMIYDTVGEQDCPKYPRIVITTSHNPSSLLKAFSKHLSLIFNGQNLARGKLSQEGLNEYCKRGGVTHLIVLNESKGNPTTFIMCKYPHGPTYKFSLFNLKFQRRQKNFGEKAYLVVDGMGSEIGSALKKNIALCFPKVENGNRLVAFINRAGTVAFRHFIVERKTLVKECEFDMRLFKVINSTIESEGVVDYVLNAFTNTRKDDVLSGEIVE